ncbi:MAG TPA: LptF/LptG family permease, partial [Ignavibacteriaceae bacterium]|nr:LptF/LptG family permease [Ignavibacteriaceae bacterium]
MKILDKYLIKQFIQTIFFGIISFTLIFVVLNMLENLGGFLDQNVPWQFIAYYYIVFSPDIIKLMTPVAVLFSALFVVGKAANLSELTAIKSSGVSLYRFMVPFLIVTFFVSLFSIYFAGYVVPLANKTKRQIEMKYLNSGFADTGNNLFFQDSQTRIVTIVYFDNIRNQANRVSIEEFDKNNLTKMVSRIDAMNMNYDSTSRSWILHNIVQRTFNDTSQTARYISSMKISYLNFSPHDLMTKQQRPEDMNLEQLNDLIKSEKASGSDPTVTQIEYYSRFSFPLASLVVVLFGLPISA